LGTGSPEEEDLLLLLEINVTPAYTITRIMMTIITLFTEKKVKVFKFGVFDIFGIFDILFIIKKN